jgi:major histocompatibility complex class I
MCGEAMLASFMSTRQSLERREPHLRKCLNKSCCKPGVVAHGFNPSTWKAEAGKFLSLGPAWSTK